ncbi:MAG TPA: asparagine synthase (glutamine-hydrolyzing) [Verrucomicrobiae bacterium]|nr:asparagine synthase (glutamine-hydrolyzing) [Verrucomicrobiae bacterium]
MCGVAGIFAYHYASNPVDRDELVRIRDHMRARGPDAEGLWLSDDGHAGLGHRRLSIIDLSAAGNQPMASADGKIVISFNGEIYNYRALRAKLEARGVRFRTQSDTEVIIESYRAYGENMFAELRGMYAFALWDADRREMLLARDPYGIKPLYYADDGWTCRVASQVKALLVSGAVSREPEPAGIVGFYLLGSVPEPFTLYQEIRSVPAGSYMRVDSLGAQAPVSHFSIARTWAAARAVRQVGNQDQTALRETLLDSVKHHLVGDVPVGAFLSSGVDSGALVGLMRDAGQRSITTVTVTFDEFRDTPADEAPLAAETARRYATDHEEYRVTRDVFREELPAALAAMDQPSIDGLNTWFVAKAAAERGLKVAVSGLGADELFGGYTSFKDVPKWARWISGPARLPGAGTIFRAFAAGFFPNASPKLRGMVDLGGSFTGAWFLRRGLFLPGDLPELLDAELLRNGLRRLRLDIRLGAALQPEPGDSFARVSTLESSFYMRNQLLRDTDWASMAHSLEVRVPYVDVELLRHCVVAPRLEKSMVASSPSVPLPMAVLQRAKTGFQTPIAQWLQEEDSLGGWRLVQGLSRPGCPWARRWSHVVGSLFAEPAL